MNRINLKDENTFLNFENQFRRFMQTFVCLNFYELLVHKNYESEKEPDDIVFTLAGEGVYETCYDGKEFEIAEWTIYPKIVNEKIVYNLFEWLFSEDVNSVNKKEHGTFTSVESLLNFFLKQQGFLDKSKLVLMPSSEILKLENKILKQGEEMATMVSIDSLEERSKDFVLDVEDRTVRESRLKMAKEFVGKFIGFLKESNG